jgi:two-component system LytT family response regulator
MKLIKIPGLDKNFGIAAEEIMRVQAISNYSRIYFADGKIVTVAKVLHWFQDELPVDMFARVHRSHLVNRMFVEKINKAQSGNLVLLNGESITISRRKRMLFLESYKNLLFVA